MMCQLSPVAEMDGPSRVRLQRRSEIREIVSDIDQLKLSYSMSAIEILTPRAEVMLRLGNKSKICLKLCYHHLSVSAKYSITLQYPMKYPSEPVEILEIKYAEDKKKEDEAPVAAVSESEEKINENIRENDGNSGVNDGERNRSEWMNEENLQHIQHLGQEYANSHTGDDGYSVNLISYLNSFLDPSHQQSRDETNPMASPIPSSQDELPLPYKCRACRQILFYSCHIQHNPIHLTSSSSSSKPSSKPCTSIFLHEIPFSAQAAEEEHQDHDVKSAVQWIQDLYSSPASSDGNGISGKITCPSCHAKVGSWSWSDAQCSCGKWFVPSLQFTVTKVDPPVALSSKNISIALPLQQSSSSLPFVETLEELGLGDDEGVESAAVIEEKDS
jgi:hypothetical protein